MKKSTILIVPFLILCAVFSSKVTYGQCDENTKMGVAIVRTEGERPETPKGAMKMPRYEGGAIAMCRYLCDNMQYPESLKQQKIDGITTVEFIVKSDGSVTNVKVANTSGYQEFDDEAVRLVESFPNWVPAQINCEENIDMKSQVEVEFNCEKCKCDKKK